MYNVLDHLASSRVKLLFDEDLSPRLVADLAHEFPDSLHVRDIGLERAMDEAVWDYARDNGLVIVWRDADFHQLSFLFGHPPKVIWGSKKGTDLLKLSYRCFDNASRTS